MKPAITLPFDDPDGIIFPHLQSFLPDLKQHFDRAYLTIPKSTQEKQPKNVRLLESDEFLELFLMDSEMQVGDHFSFLYRQVTSAVHPEQILHLCYPDRLSYALCAGYREQFFADVDALDRESLPLIFCRSEKAWKTHPKNYFEIESFMTRMGWTLFGKWLDYGWCHLVIQAKQLQAIMPFIKSHDMRMVAEMILNVQEDVKTRDVDWLAWEDPFLLGRDADELRHEREQSLEETQKRLSYVLPIAELLTKFAVNGRE